MESNIITSFPIWTIAKLLFLLGLAIYLIFSLVVVKQVRIMTDTLEVGFEGAIRTLAYVHLGFAIVVFLLALIFL